MYGFTGFGSHSTEALIDIEVGASSAELSTHHHDDSEEL